MLKNKKLKKYSSKAAKRLQILDKSINRKAVIVKDSLGFVDDIPIFSIIEFNLINKCNRSCVFCPVSEEGFYEKTGIDKKLDIALYKKIIKELQAISYQGKILFSGFSEPMLHKGVYDFVGLASKYVPLASVEIVSNGDIFLKKGGVDRLKRLFDSGLKTISISLYDGEHQLDDFQELKIKAKLSDDQVILRRRYLDNGNYGMIISNRGGLIESNKFRDEKEDFISREDLPLKKVCYYPFYMTKVDSNGDVLICSQDWRKELILGNLETDMIMDIWKGDKLQIVKSNLSKCNRGMIPCDTCDVNGDVIGKENYNEWIKSRLNIGQS